MKKNDFVDIIQNVEKAKIELMRPLTDDEIANILKDCDKLSFLQKRKVVKKAMCGIDSIRDLYSMCKGVDVNSDKSRYNFLLLSINSVEKKLSELGAYIAASEYPSEQLIQDYYISNMMLICIKEKFGLSIKDNNIFIDAHKDLYDEFSLVNQRGQKK